MGEQVTVDKYQLDSLRREAEEGKKYSGVASAMRTLLAVVKNSLLTLWWVIGLGGATALFFYPMPQNRLQFIVFAAVSVVYALISRGLYKVKEVEEKHT